MKYTLIPRFLKCPWLYMSWDDDLTSAGIYIKICIVVVAERTSKKTDLTPEVREFLGNFLPHQSFTPRRPGYRGQ